RRLWAKHKSNWNKHKPNWKRGMTKEKLIRDERFRKMMQVEDGFGVDEVDYHDD
ncbi:7356_t:CDS:1, partial [Paraglomus occultum]